MEGCNGNEDWQVKRLDVPTSHFMDVSQNTVLVVVGGWVHLRLLNHAKVKVVGVKSKGGQSPRIRVAGKGAIALLDVEPKSVEVVGDVRVFR